MASGYDATLDVLLNLVNQGTVNSYLKDLQNLKIAPKINLGVQLKKHTGDFDEIASLVGRSFERKIRSAITSALSGTSGAGMLSEASLLRSLLPRQLSQTLKMGTHKSAFQPKLEEVFRQIIDHNVDEIYAASVRATDRATAKIMAGGSPQQKVMAKLKTLEGSMGSVGQQIEQSLRHVFRDIDNIASQVKVPSGLKFTTAAKGAVNKTVKSLIAGGSGSDRMSAASQVLAQEIADAEKLLQANLRSTDPATRKKAFEDFRKRVVSRTGKRTKGLMDWAGVDEFQQAVNESVNFRTQAFEQIAQQDLAVSYTLEEYARKVYQRAKRVGKPHLDAVAAAEAELKSLGALAGVNVAPALAGSGIHYQRTAGGPNPLNDLRRDFSKSSINNAFRSEIDERGLFGVDARAASESLHASMRSRLASSLNPTDPKFGLYEDRLNAAHAGYVRGDAPGTIDTLAQNLYRQMTGSLGGTSGASSSQYQAAYDKSIKATETQIARLETEKAGAAKGSVQEKDLTEELRRQNVILQNMKSARRSISELMEQELKIQEDIIKLQNQGNGLTFGKMRDAQIGAKQLELEKVQQKIAGVTSGSGNRAGQRQWNFAAMQAAYGFQDFFQVTAAGQGPVKGLLAAANNLGPALMGLGIGGVAANVGIGVMLAGMTGLSALANREKKEIDSLKDSVDQLTRSLRGASELQMKLVHDAPSGKGIGGRVGSGMLEQIAGTSWGSGDLATRLATAEVRMARNADGFTPMPRGWGLSQGIGEHLGSSTPWGDLYRGARGVGTAFSETFFGYSKENRTAKNDEERYFPHPKTIAQIRNERPEVDGVSGREHQAIRYVRDQLTAQREELEKGGFIKEYTEHRNTLKQQREDIAAISRNADRMPQETLYGFQKASDLERNFDMRGARHGYLESLLDQPQKMEAELDSVMRRRDAGTEHRTSRFQRLEGAGAGISRRAEALQGQMGIRAGLAPTIEDEADYNLLNATYATALGVKKIDNDHLLAISLLIDQEREAHQRELDALNAEADVDEKLVELAKKRLKHAQALPERIAKDSPEAKVILEGIRLTRKLHEIGNQMDRQSRGGFLDSKIYGSGATQATGKHLNFNDTLRNIHEDYLLDNAKAGVDPQAQAAAGRIRDKKLASAIQGFLPNEQGRVHVGNTVDLHRSIQESLTNDPAKQLDQKQVDLLQRILDTLLGNGKGGDVGAAGLDALRRGEVLGNQGLQPGQQGGFFSVQDDFKKARFAADTRRFEINDALAASASRWRVQSGRLGMSGSYRSDRPALPSAASRRAAALLPRPASFSVTRLPGGEHLIPAIPSRRSAAATAESHDTGLAQFEAHRASGLSVAEMNRRQAADDSLKSRYRVGRTPGMAGDGYKAWKSGQDLANSLGPVYGTGEMGQRMSQFVSDLDAGRLKKPGMMSADLGMTQALGGVHAAPAKLTQRQRQEAQLQRDMTRQENEWGFEERYSKYKLQSGRLTTHGFDRDRRPEGAKSTGTTGTKAERQGRALADKGKADFNSEGEYDYQTGTFKTGRMKWQDFNANRDSLRKGLTGRAGIHAEAQQRLFKELDIDGDDPKQLGKGGKFGLISRHRERFDELKKQVEQERDPQPVAPGKGPSMFQVGPHQDYNPLVPSRGAEAKAEQLPKLSEETRDAVSKAGQETVKALGEMIEALKEQFGNLKRDGIKISNN